MYILGSHWWYKYDFLAKARGPGHPGYSGRAHRSITSNKIIHVPMAYVGPILALRRAVLGTCSAMTG